MAIIVVTLGFVAFTYFGNYYSYGNHARKALKSTDAVTVSTEDGILFFDGPGSEKAIIFYPGAKVATEAYAPLMQGLAKDGFDCFLVGMPLHFACFGRERASEIMARYDYDEFIMAGHSLGGAEASKYLAEHSEDFSGLILLGSYPTVKIDENINFLSVMGSNDGIVNQSRLEKSRKNRPKDNSHDVFIFGGNHAYFGNYGKQDGDKEATIKPKTQWRQTIEAIEEYF